MTSREALSLYVIQVSLGVGGSFLAAVFVSEAIFHGGIFVPFAVGTYIAIGACVRLFGSVRVSRYILATVAWLAVIVVAGLP